MKKRNLLASILSVVMFLSGCSMTDFADSGLFESQESHNEISSSVDYSSEESASASESESASASESESASASESASNEESVSPETSSDDDFTSEDNSAEDSQESSEDADSSSEDDNSSDNGGGDNNTCKDTHTDKDGDGECDVCEISVVLTFDVFAINDLHGKFADTDSQPGVDELSTYFKQARAKNENTILLSSGDMWQGASESNLTKGAILTDWMSAMGFASMTLGNHEYDWGETYVESNAELAEFPFLAINVYDSDTNKLADYCQPSVMVEQNGAKIGIIGAIGDCHSSISGEHSSGFYFKTGSELTALVKAESERLRAQGADCIIYSLHDGYGSSSSSVSSISDSKLSSYYDVSLSNGYVDLVFEGHSHQNYVLKDSKGVYHLQGGGDNDGISHATITVNIASSTSQVATVEYVPTSVYSNLADDSIVEELLAKYEKEISLANKVLGVNDKVRSGDEICQLVSQLYYEVGAERWGDEYDIVLGGGFLNVRSPYNIYAGEVTYGDVQGVLPFDNEIVLCSIKGSYLKSKFVETTNSNYYITYGEYGESIKANINSSATYYLITDTYTSTYGPNNLTEVARYDANVFARDLVAEYIQQGGFTSGDNSGSTEIKLTSIPDIITIGNALSSGATTSESYYVKGTIVSINNTTYGNMTIKDENGNTLYIYGLNDKTGAVRYDSLPTKPQVGDTIIIAGPIQKYGTTIEIYHGRLQSIE